MIHPTTADTLARTVKVLAFDIFGTVVDWHGSIVREVRALYPAVDADAFALAWRAGYQPAMARVMRGEQGWTLIDALHRQILDEILPRFGLAHLSEAERAHLNRAWHRLDAWADSVEGLTRLKARFTITSLSNGNIVNHSREAVRRVDINLGIDYASDIRQAREVLLEIARDPRVRQDPAAPQVVVTGLGDNAVALSLRVWVASADYWSVSFEFIEQAKERLERVGIGIPFPQRVVHLIQQ